MRPNRKPDRSDKGSAGRVIPFDPDELRGKGIQNRDVREPWPEFGSLKDLNRRVPMAFHYMPPTSVQSPTAT